MDACDYSEFVDRLIKEVKSHDCIFNKQHISYNSKPERENAWIEISKAVGQSSEDCQKRWKLLREKFAKELKKRDRAQICGRAYKSDWSCFKNILFIENFIQPRTSRQFRERFISECEDSITNSSSYNVQLVDKCTTSKPKAKRLCKRSSEVLELESSGCADDVLQLETDQFLTVTVKEEQFDDLSREGENYESNDNINGTIPERRQNETPMPKTNTMSEENEKSLLLCNCNKNATTITSCPEDGDVLFGKIVTTMLREIPSDENKDNAKLQIFQHLINAKRTSRNKNNKSSNLT